VDLWIHSPVRRSPLPHVRSSFCKSEGTPPYMGRLKDMNSLAQGSLFPSGDSNPDLLTEISK
jgi:hypothetical protein